MSKFFQPRAIAAAVGACAALLASSSANAFVYGISHLEVQNLTIGVTGATTTVESFTFTLANTAALNGAPVVTGANCGGNLTSNTCSAVSPTLDAGANNAPGSTLLRVNNVYSFLGKDQTNSYSGSDNVITSAELVQFGSPTNTNQIAESLLNSNGFASANSEITSNTTLTWTINIGANGATLSLNFNADPDQQSLINDLFAGVFSSLTNMNATFTLSDNAGRGDVSWSPQGTAGSNCIVTDSGGFAGVACAETADGADLNDNTTTGTNNNIADENSFEAANVFAAFGIDITGLPAGTYSLGLNSVTSTSIIRQAVPEPASVALIGLALAGLGVARRRRQAR